MAEDDNTPTLPPPPPAPPPIRHEFMRREGRRWPVIILILLAALLISVGVVFLGRWIYRSAHDHNSKPTTAVQQKQAASNTRPTESGAGKSSAPSQKKTQSTSNTLPNNGPGNLAAIFTAATVLSAGTHYIIRSRQRTRSSTKH